MTGRTSGSTPDEEPVDDAVDPTDPAASDASDKSDVDDEQADDQVDEIDADADAEDDAEDEDDAPARQRRTPRRTVPAYVARIVLVLAIVAGVAAVGVIGWTVATRSWIVGGVELAGDQQQIQDQRDEVMGVGRQFVLRLGNYGPEGLDEQGQLADYRESVGEVLTPGFRNSFFETLPLVEAGVAQSGVTREAEVFATGVVEMNDTEAGVLVAGVFNDTQDGQPVGQPVALRLQVELVRVDGEWLVDNFTGVQAPDEEQQTPIDPDLDIPEPDPTGGQGTPGGQGNQGNQGGQGGQRGGGGR